MKRSTYERVRKRHLRVLNEVPTVNMEHAQLHVTKNSKTGLSVDFPVIHTCQPTAVCMGTDGMANAPCYALTGFMAMAPSVRKQQHNLLLVNYLEHAPKTHVDRVCQLLWEQIPRSRDWLRWNGAGDLVAGAVRVINTFTEKFPEIRIWIISRKVQEAQWIEDRPGVRLMLSTDYSTPPEIRRRMRKLRQKYKHGKAYLAYTRTEESDHAPKGIHVVFNKHSGGRFHAWAHPCVCPASLPGNDHVGACQKCQWCFR